MVIAFIPVRGGSKSIPLKNIKEFCGKPLVYWTLSALHQIESVDEIIVSSDSAKIEKVVELFNFEKVKIYHRSKKNASDTASSESAMLEYINHAQLNENDIFILVQATSPLTQTIHFEEALEIYKSGKFNSMLTCVRNKRFFWDVNGTPLNYDYKNRPRRQNFDGVLMENGAFYINKVGNISKYENRLCEKIGIFEMPEYTSIEIDEPDDWVVLESLMRKYVLTKDRLEK